MSGIVMAGQAGFFNQASTKESMFGKTGIPIGLNTYFIDVAEFAAISDGGDFTYLHYCNELVSGTGSIVVYAQSGVSGGDSHIYFNAKSVVQNNTEKTSGLGLSSGFTGLCVTRNSDVIDVYHVDNLGVVRSDLDVSINSISTPDNFVSIGATLLNEGVTATGEIISIQFKDSGMSGVDITEMLDNYYLMDDADRDYLYFENLSGSSDNGAYPAKMTGYSTPSPYDILYSDDFDAATAAWRGFDSLSSSRMALLASGGGAANAFVTVDLGVGNTEVIDRIIIKNLGGFGVNSFTFAGSNDNSSFTDLLTDNATNSTTFDYFDVTNVTAYRYYRLWCNSGFNASFDQIQEVILINKSKEWAVGAGYAKDGAITFPT